MLWTKWAIKWCVCVVNFGSRSIHDLVDAVILSVYSAAAKAIHIRGNKTNAVTEKSRMSEQVRHFYAIEFLFCFVFWTFWNILKISLKPILYKPILLQLVWTLTVVVHCMLISYKVTGSVLNLQYAFKRLVILFLFSTASSLYSLHILCEMLYTAVLEMIRIIANSKGFTYSVSGYCTL